ncbi:MAG: DUF1254 domain-containing protein, partial [Desulfobacterales bacterium]
MKKTCFRNCLNIALTVVAVYSMSLPANGEVSRETLASISTPDKVKTSIGTLKFRDGAPLPETADKVYNYLDTTRAMDTFLKGQPACSVVALIKGAHSLGAVEANEIIIFDKLMDSTPLFLTGNTSTLYVLPDLDLKRDGPTIVEVPDGLLGAANDSYFRYINDLMKAGKYLYLPPGYKGKVPKGYTVLKPKSYRVWIFLRASIANGLDKATRFVKSNLKVYPLSMAGNPPKIMFISASGKSFNTIHPNNVEFYDHLNDIIQYESLEMLDPETRGLFASIGIEKGKPFVPDARMKKILVDGVALGNAVSRSIVWYPRVDGTMKGIEIYPDTHSAWMMSWVDKNVFFNGKDGHTMNSDARVMFYYPYTAVTPAMAVSRPGLGSDYGIAYVDAEKRLLDGAKVYKLHLPPNVPVNNFWAVTIYDTQTRSQLQTGQKFPTVGSQTKSIEQNEDGSFDIYFSPKPPKG